MGLEETQSRLVWARHDVATDTCPKSYVTAQSWEWLEQFVVWRRLGYRGPAEPSAREVEAFMILENEMQTEGHRGRE